jgi:L-ascorbate metabolism protein UlaG (beta-lactamase superfamily)
VTTPHAARKLGRQGFTAPVPLRSWEVHTLRHGEEELRITALPGRHGPLPVAWLLPETMGSLLEWTAPGRDPLRLYITGDTLVQGGVAEVAERIGPIDCELIHLGGTRVLGILVTMDGDQGEQAVRLTRPRHVVPIHHDGYTVMRSPLTDFTGRFPDGRLAGSELVVAPRGEPLAIPGAVRR